MINVGKKTVLANFIAEPHKVVLFKKLAKVQGRTLSWLYGELMEKYIQNAIKTGLLTKEEYERIKKECE